MPAQVAQDVPAKDAEILRPHSPIDSRQFGRSQSRKHFCQTAGAELLLRFDHLIANGVTNQAGN
jgi:hypothetical protein